MFKPMLCGAGVIFAVLGGVTACLAQKASP